MQMHGRRTSQKASRTPAVVVAIPGLALFLALAAPAAAKPARITPTPGEAVSAAGSLVMIAAVALAVVALILLGWFAAHAGSGRRAASSSRRHGEPADDRSRVAA